MPSTIVVAFLLSVWVAASPDLRTQASGPAKAAKCDYLRTYALETADCSNREFKVVPRDLRTNIQVLDLSRNRFRHITNTSFDLYTSLTILYLSENVILKIDGSAFRPLSNLGVLDLSSNAISDLSAIYFPPTMYRLYLAENPVKNFSLNRMTSLKSLSFGDLDTYQLPYLGMSPSLVELNISVSPIKKLSPIDIAAFCKLEYVYVNPDHLFQDKTNDTLCDCLKLEKWVTQKKIEIRSFLCKYEKNVKVVCDTEPDVTTNQVYNNCLSEYQFRQVPTVVLTSAAILAGLILLCIVVYYRCRKRNAKRSKSAARPARFQESNVQFMNDK